jgi:hypothetical protein
MIEIEINQEQLADAIRRLDYIKNGANRALSRALNKTASKAKTESSKAIRQQVRLTATYVRERLMGPANGFAYKATINKLQSKIAAPTRGLRLDHFLTSLSPYRAGRPTDPIKVKVKPKGASIAMPSAFWVRAKNSGGYLIAMRNDVLRASGAKTKLSSGEYTVLSGPSLSQVFTTVKDDVSPNMNDYLATVFDREVQYLLDTNTPPDDGVGG